MALRPMIEFLISDRMPVLVIFTVFISKIW